MSNYSQRKKWRLKNPESRNASRRRNYDSTRKFGKKGGKTWSKREVEAILSLTRPTDRTLAKKLGRTVRSIQGKRARLKRKKSM